VKRKPVVEATTDTMWDYEYQAKHYGHKEMTILASDSLRNLKLHIKENTWWRLAWLTTSNGYFTYGQNIINEYPYMPRR